MWGPRGSRVHRWPFLFRFSKTKRVAQINSGQKETRLQYFSASTLRHQNWYSWAFLILQWHKRNQRRTFEKLISKKSSTAQYHSGMNIDIILIGFHCIWQLCGVHVSAVRWALSSGPLLAPGCAESFQWFAAVFVVLARISDTVHLDSCNWLGRFETTTTTELNSLFWAIFRCLKAVPYI